MNGVEISPLRTFQQMLLDGDMDIAKLRTHSMLRKDDWKAFDDKVVEISRDRLAIFSDFRDRGLIRNLGGLGVLMDEWETSSDMTGAKIDLDGVTDSDEDAAEWRLHGVPIPVIHKGFRLNVRRVASARRNGTAIDTTQIAIATRHITDSIEDMILNGVPGLAVDGRPVYGLLTHPDRNTYTTASVWGTKTVAWATVKAAAEMAFDDNHFGPFNLYLNATQWNTLLNPEGADNFVSAFDRIMGLPYINSIKPSQAVPAGTAVLVQMTEDVADIAVGQDIQTIQWDEKGGLVERFKVMAALAPRVKSDDDGRSGVVHITNIT